MTSRSIAAIASPSSGSGSCSGSYALSESCREQASRPPESGSRGSLLSLRSDRYTSVITGSTIGRRPIC